MEKSELKKNCPHSMGHFYTMALAGIELLASKMMTLKDRRLIPLRQNKI